MGQKNYEIEWHTISLRTISILLLGVAGLALFLSYKYFIKPTLPGDSPPKTVEKAFAARFVDYEGRVEVKPRDKYGWLDANLKIDLQEQDRIRTHSSASARIRFEDGTEITIQSNSIVVLNRQMASRASGSAPLLEIETGRGDINAEKSRSTPAVKTSKINRVTFSQGGSGSVEVDSRTGESRAVVRRGGAQLDIGGKRMALGELEEAKVAGDSKITRIQLPGIPQIYSPQNGQIFEFAGEKGRNIDLAWRDVARAERYHVQLADHSLFAKIRLENSRLAGSSFNVAIPFSGKKQYYWRVRSIDSRNNEGAWSPAYVFVVQPARAKAPGAKPGPPITITYMHPFHPYLQIDGRTAPESFLTLNGEVVDVKDDGTFVYTYTLKKTGVNDLVFASEDPAGNRTTLKRQYNYRQ